MPLDYLVLRLIRHFLPNVVVHFLLRRGWIIKPGLETRQPETAVERYAQVLEAHGISLGGKRVLIFGYGGNFAVGVHFLQSGAAHVVLVDKYARPDDRRNRLLWPEFKAYLTLDGERVRPDPRHITLIEGDLDPMRLDPVDVVVSNSVYEHLPRDGVDEITRALALLTAPDGVHIHYVDLRDHYFKYPFEMLAYPEGIWQRWLNPGSNLNRLRLGDYQGLFERHFQRVEIEVLARDEEALERARPRIRPEFLTGDPSIDAVTAIRVVASGPKR